MRSGAFNDKSLVWNRWLEFNDKKKEGLGWGGIWSDFNLSSLIIHFLAWFSDKVQNKQFMFVLLPLPLNFWT